MKKLSKILAAHMDCDVEKADLAVDRMHERLRKRAEKTGKRMHLHGSPDDRMVQSAMESPAELRAFDMMTAVLEELLEDVDMEEIEQAGPPEKAWN